MTPITREDLERWRYAVEQDDDSMGLGGSVLHDAVEALIPLAERVMEAKPEECDAGQFDHRLEGHVVLPNTAWDAIAELVE